MPNRSRLRNREGDRSQKTVTLTATATYRGDPTTTQGQKKAPPD